MTIFDIYRAIMKRLGLIILITAVFGMAAAFVSWFTMDDVYQASASIIVSSQKNKQDNTGLTYNDYTLNINLVNSYQVLCKADRVLSQVIKVTGVPLTVDELRPKITVESQKDTEIFSVSVRDKDPAVAQTLANSLADVFQREVITIMKMDNVQIIDYAKLPTKPVEPNRPQNVLLALVLGLAAGVGLALLIDFLDVSIRSVEQVEEIINAPVLGCVPHIQQSKAR